MDQDKLQELIQELKRMTPAAAFPCRADKEIKNIKRICLVWNMLFNKINEAYKENPEIFTVEIVNEWKKISRARTRYIKAQRRVLKKINSVEYDFILGSISIAAFHKNSMVELESLFYKEEQCSTTKI